MPVLFQRGNRFVAYLEREWRWIPICKYHPRYDFVLHKQKKYSPGSKYAYRWHEEIMPSPGNSIRAAWPYSIARFTQLAVLSILWIPPLVASGCKTVKYRKLQNPQKPGKERNRGTSQEKGRTEEFRSKTLAHDVSYRISYTWNHRLLKPRIEMLPKSNRFNGSILFRRHWQSKFDVQYNSRTIFLLDELRLSFCVETIVIDKYIILICKRK